MPTEPRHAAPCALFVFAHPDDEFGVFQTILDCLRQGMRVRCAYFTTSATAALSARREAESRRVLAALGVAAHDIAFAGAELAIPDASLPTRLAPAAAWLTAWLGAADAPRLLCAPAWEGGHHDHDALHALAVDCAARAGLLQIVKQYPLYNRHGCVGPFFNVLSPLVLNGKIQASVIPWKNRLRFCRYCLSYPSQRRTWIGLFPFVLLHYARRGVQTLQPVTAERTLQRPHPGTLYYEHRAFYTWEQMCQQLRAWRAQC